MEGDAEQKWIYGSHNSQPWGSFIIKNPKLISGLKKSRSFKIYNYENFYIPRGYKSLSEFK